MTAAASPPQSANDASSTQPPTHAGGGGEPLTDNAPDSAPFLDDDEKPPNDRHSLVYFIFLLHGIGVLLPWNTFLTISKDYFIEYKLANATGTNYHTNFFGYLGACSQIPNLTCNLINLFIIVHGAGLVRRIFVSLFVITLVCFFTIAMVFVESQSWPFLFFALTMASVVLLNSANGIYQNSIFGLASDFPWRFTNAVILGSNACGTFIAILAILIMLFSSNIKWSAFLYFGISFLTVVACAISFASLSKFSFYRFYIQKAEKARHDRRKTENLLLDANGGGGENGGVATTPSNGGGDGAVLDVEPAVSLSAYLSILRESWRHMLDVFLVFFVTLAIYPTILVKVELYPQGRQYDLFIQKKLFTPVFIFLNFNAFALLGNFIANYIQWPSPKYLTGIVAPRLLFIPIFLLCNYVPLKERQALPALITNEWAFVILISLLAISHGYCSSLAMMYAPKMVHGSKSQLAGMMSAFLLVLGITLGVLFTFVEVYLFS